jgi:hypothetical protein
MSATTSAKSCCTVMVNDIEFEKAVHAQTTTRMLMRLGNYPVNTPPDSRGLA